VFGFISYTLGSSWSGHQTAAHLTPRTSSGTPYTHISAADKRHATKSLRPDPASIDAEDVAYKLEQQQQQQQQQQQHQEEKEPRVGPQSSDQHVSAQEQPPPRVGAGAPSRLSNADNAENELPTPPPPRANVKPPPPVLTGAKPALALSCARRP
jgi:hypothetical protein